MDILYTVINIAVLLILIGLLIWMQKKHFSFTKRVFTGLGAGIVLGAILQLIYGAGSNVLAETAEWYSIVGSGYIRFLMMIVVPLVMVSIIQSIINLEKTAELGKMSAWIIGILISTTMIAALIGIVSATVFDLSAEQIEAGQAEDERGNMLETTLGEVEEQSAPQKILNFIPSNIFLDMTGERSTSVIAVVIFSVIVGIAVLGVRRKNPEQAEMFTKIVNSFYAVVMRIVTLILRLTPYGILALMANTVATTDFAGILELGKFVLASYAALLVMFVIHLILVSLFGLNPFTYLRKVIPVLGFAFTSRSSAGTIPLNIQAQRNSLGVDQGVANMSASFGATMGQNGCAGIYPAMLAVMIAPTVGIDPLSPAFIIQLVLIIGISSFGIAGVGGGATFAALIVLSSMNLPVALAGLLISIEAFIDMGRTALNVNGSMVSGTLTSRILNKMNVKTYNDKTAIEETTSL
ncbi:MULTISPECIES: L-cystine transporter [Virgibacillus]|uniref:L-cystine uptake protein TcyP n=2 Tax=Virgibacillus TaxID=84406 RepID=A0A024Q7N3_9BACI|nr:MULTISPECIES: L-cystine transporter [Virgibacillus]EQB38255.1 L-cystine transporter tcyP [Virgibacillus sp. CM-4]MYL40961.1 cation:dicarboxylase symporter family transporter [Virgibacillus massiliensis]GGJ53154.1 L-cystine uptake protein TcyP [Virgibacillus kapii]CDQ38240.1 Transporter of cystine TcyP [Virgibacillus massiliensis]